LSFGGYDGGILSGIARHASTAVTNVSHGYATLPPRRPAGTTTATSFTTATTAPRSHRLLRPAPVLVWTETKILPEKAVGFELQAQRDCLAIALGNADHYRALPTAKDASLARSCLGGVTQPQQMIGSSASAATADAAPPTVTAGNAAGNMAGNTAGGRISTGGMSTSLRSLFVLGVRNKTARGIVRTLVGAASRVGLIPPGDQAQQQAVDSLLREDMGASHLAGRRGEGGGGGGSSGGGLNVSSISSSTDLSPASCASAVYGDLGLSSPWEKVFHARGFIVAVGHVSGGEAQCDPYTHQMYSP
jgi:hypothetical protein